MDARLLDEIATAATVAHTEADVAGWWCKAAPDLPFRRCNTVLPAAGAGGDRDAFAHSLGAVRAWYGDLGQRLIVQVTTADPTHEQLDRWLAAEGLEVEAPVDLMVSPIGGGAGPARPAGQVHRQAGIDERWALAHGRLHGGSPAQQTRTLAYGRMLEQLGERALGASLEQEGQVVGVGFGVVDRGWVGVFGMATAPDHRRQGVATAVLGALLAGAADRGATQAYLQVETDNHGAIALYHGLGFAPHHRYHYRSQRGLPSTGT